MFIIPIGMSLQSSAVVGWSPINYYDLNVRAVAVAAIVMIGNSGGVVASYLFPSTDAPHYGNCKQIAFLSRFGFLTHDASLWKRF